jgi:hypothetical protein
MGALGARDRIPSHLGTAHSKSACVCANSRSAGVAIMQLAAAAQAAASGGS